MNSQSSIPKSINPSPSPSLNQPKICPSLVGGKPNLFLTSFKNTKPSNFNLSLAQFCSAISVIKFWSLSFSHAVEYLSNLSVNGLSLTASPWTLVAITSPFSSTTSSISTPSIISFAVNPCSAPAFNLLTKVAYAVETVAKAADKAISLFFWTLYEQNTAAIVAEYNANGIAYFLANSIPVSIYNFFKSLAASCSV